MKRLVVLPVLLVLAAACAARPNSGTAPPPSKGVIQGTVRLGPLCPVQSVASPCPDRPVEAWIDVHAPDGKWQSFRTSADGRFSIPLPPGTYQVRAREIGDNPRVSKFATAAVRLGAVSTVDLQIDTGIR